MKEADGPESCKTNMSQEIVDIEEYYTNTDKDSHFENEDMPMATDNYNNNIQISSRPQQQ